LNNIIIISAPSGSGKTTIVKHMLALIPQLEFSTSATTRDKRNTEVSGQDYYFFSVKDFKSKIKSGDFIEYQEVYPDQFYGTLKSEMNRIHSENKIVILDMDVIGGSKLTKQFKENSISIFIKPPSIEELKNRLVNRSTETQASLEKRIEKSVLEMEYADQFDFVIINDDLKTAINTTENVIRENI
jgi:guanylate kinase